MNILSIVGLSALLYALVAIALWVYRNFVHDSKLTGKDTYAVVTGATAGVGEGYAEELASRKFNLVLVSRSQSKLDELANRLGEYFTCF